MIPDWLIEKANYKCNPNNWDCFENAIPISIFCVKTNELIATYPTINKANNELVGRRGVITNAIRRQETNGKIATFKIRDGRRAYAKRIKTN